MRNYIFPKLSALNKMAPSRCTCSVCSKQIRENSGSISCTNCKNWFHKKCSDLSDGEFKKIAADLKKTGHNKWQCSRCIFEVSIVESDNESDGDVSDLPLATSKSEIERIFKKYLAPFKEKMERIESSVAGIRSDLNKFAEQNKTLAQQHKQLDKRVGDVENKLASLSECSIDSNNIIAEINERKKRETEVIVLNVPESTKPVGDDRRHDDHAKIAAVIPPEFKEIVPSLKLRRLGRPTAGKTRPLLINTSSATDARTLLKIKPISETNISFKPNLTKDQQNHLKTLRTELETLTVNGDNNKTIKYINGIPRIIDKNNFRTPKEKPKET